MKDSLTKLINNNMELPTFAQAGNYQLRNTGFWPQKSTAQWWLFFTVNFAVSLGLGLIGFDLFPQQRYQSATLDPQVVVSTIINMIIISAFRLALWVHDSKRKAEPLEIEPRLGGILPAVQGAVKKAELRVFPSKDRGDQQFRVYTGLTVTYEDGSKVHLNRLSVPQIPEYAQWLQTQHNVTLNTKTSWLKKIPLWTFYLLFIMVAALMAVRLYLLY